MKYLTQPKFLIILLAASLLTINGCSVRYVADYDASVKQEILRVAKKWIFFGVGY